MAYFVKAAFGAIYAAGSDPYYEGEQDEFSDISVLPRPDATHIWNGTAWMPDTALSAAAAKDKLASDLQPSDPQGIRFAEELFSALKAKGVLADTDINAIALANINTRRSIRGQGPL